MNLQQVLRCIATPWNQKLGSYHCYTMITGSQPSETSRTTLNPHQLSLQDPLPPSVAPPAFHYTYTGKSGRFFKYYQEATRVRLTTLTSHIHPADLARDDAHVTSPLFYQVKDIINT